MCLIYIKIIYFVVLFIFLVSIIPFKFKLIYSPFIYIPIAFSIDNSYTYPLIVLLTSILYNSKPRTLYYFHIMIPNNFFEENKKKIEGLCKKYNKCKVIFLNMGNKYKDWKTFRYYSKAVYYRLSLSDLVKNFDKIIYLDIDTMVHNDLTNFFNIEMGDKCYMGFPGIEVKHTIIKGTRNFINSGVMLINLKLLRKVNASLLFDKFYYTYGTKKQDEYLINAVFYNNISFLPFEYGIPDFGKDRKIIYSPSRFWKAFGGYSNGTEKEMILASNNRIITHGAYTLKKWWRRKYTSLSKIGKKWIYYASKSNVFNEICNTFKQYQTVCSKLK